MTRLEALEAVADAARDWMIAKSGAAAAVAADWLEHRVRALDALPAAPTQAQAQAQGEAVEVLMVEDKNNAEVRFFRVGSKSAQSYGEHWAYSNLGPTVLTIRATEGGGE